MGGSPATSPLRPEVSPRRGVLAEAADPLNMQIAWDAVRGRAMRDGVPSAALLEFTAHAERNLQALAAGLLDGTYRPGRLHRASIAKSGGGRREFGIPPLRDRVVERALHQALVRRLDPLFSPWSFAYRTGCGTGDAVAALVACRDEGDQVVLRADVTDCFGSIDQRRLLRFVVEALPGEDEALFETIRRLARLDRERADEGGGVGIPQGAPLSPLLTNLYLTQLDERLAARAVRAIRYADDLALPARRLKEFAYIRTILFSELGRLGLCSSASKERLTSFAEGVVFLGDEVTSCAPQAPDRVATPDARVLHVVREGARVRLQKGQLVVEQGEKVLHRAPVGAIEHVVLWGNVALSAGLRSHALVRGLEVTFISRRGSWLGRLDSPNGSFSHRRRAQYAATADPAVAAAVGRAIVAGKIANQRALLQRYARRDASARTGKAVRRLAAAHREAWAARDVASLRGVEGAAARAYFAALATLLPSSFGFTGRVKRPPRDVVNAALSYGYAILTAEAVAAVAAAGMDPYVGFLHTDLRNGAPGLGLDLVEEFRPVVVDTTVLDLLSRKRIKPGDRRSDGDRPGVLLSDRAKRRLLAAYERRMLTIFAHVPSGQRTTYRRALHLQARQLAAVIEGRLAEYQPVSWR